MKKGCFWIIGLFILFFMLGKCSSSSQDTNNQEPSISTELSEEEKAQVAAEKVKQDSLNNIKVKELKKYFSEKKDEFSNIVWIEPNTRPKYTNQNGYCMYFCIENGIATNPRLLLQYEADNWLFIQNMIFNIDGENYTFIPDKMETDCGGGRIWEWCDQSAANYEPLIKKIAYAKTVKIKFVGKQYHSIKNMSSKQIEYFKHSYEYYKALGGRFN